MTGAEIDRFFREHDIEYLSQLGTAAFPIDPAGGSGIHGVVVLQILFGSVTMKGVTHDGLLTLL